MDCRIPPQPYRYSSTRIAASSPKQVTFKGHSAAISQTTDDVNPSGANKAKYVGKSALTFAGLFGGIGLIGGIHGALIMGTIGLVYGAFCGGVNALTKSNI